MQPIHEAIRGCQFSNNDFDWLFSRADVNESIHRFSAKIVSSDSLHRRKIQLATVGFNWPVPKINWSGPTDPRLKSPV